MFMLSSEIYTVGRQLEAVAKALVLVQQPALIAVLEDIRQRGPA
jgi:hypothetical protein